MKLTPYFYCKHDCQQTRHESQFCSKIAYKQTEVNRDKKFSSLQNRNIIFSFIKKLIFMKEIDCHLEDQCRKTNQTSLQCFSVQATPCGLVTSNGGHFHTTARCLHLLASKVLFEDRKCISNTMRVKYKYSSHYFSCESSSQQARKDF